MKGEFSFTLLDILCLFVGGIGCLFSLAMSFSPITYYDSLVYHLALPSLIPKMVLSETFHLICTPLFRN